LSEEEFGNTEGLDDWNLVDDGLESVFRAGSYDGAAWIVAAVAAVANDLDHHPDMDVRYPDQVWIRTTTHATSGLTTRDIDLAKVVSELARQAGATAEPIKNRTRPNTEPAADDAQPGQPEANGDGPQIS